MKYKKFIKTMFFTFWSSIAIIIIGALLSIFVTEKITSIMLVTGLAGFAISSLLMLFVLTWETINEN